ncbi:hypothetical protein D9M70_532900 [compost metagenome]
MAASPRDGQRHKQKVLERKCCDGAKEMLSDNPQHVMACSQWKGTCGFVFSNLDVRRFHGTTARRFCVVQFSMPTLSQKIRGHLIAL